MENQIEEIKKKIDIVDFIGSFIALKKIGRNLKAVCPFHQEKTPSFIVSPERQIWRCFGACQTGGDVISFLMKWENITFFEALKELAEKTGVKLSSVEFGDDTWKKKERLMLLNLQAAEYYQYILHKSSFGKKALDYLQDRKINTEIIRKFTLGYALNSWDSLLKFLKKKRYSEEEIFEAGLIVRREKGGYYDRFRRRLMFPIKDVKGNILGFSGRVLDAKSVEAKYINTPETTIYHKRESLFGINLAKEGIKREKNVILVEGEFDVISPYQYGVENIVAIKGSAITKEQLTLLKRFTQKITLALDSDLSGHEAMKRGIEEAENLEFEIYVIVFDFAKDPDEASRKDLVRFKQVIEKPIPVYDFVINLAMKKYDSKDPFSKKRIANEIIPYLEKVKNPILKSHYLKTLSDILKVDEESISLLISSYGQKFKHSKNYIQDLKSRDIKSENFLINRDTMIQKYFLSQVFQDEKVFNLTDKIFKILETDDFSIPAYQKIVTFFLAESFSARKEMGLDKFVPYFVKKLPRELQPVFDEVYLFASLELGLEDENIRKLVFEIKRDALKRKISGLLAEQDSTSVNLDKKISVLTSALKQLEKRLLTL